MWIAVWPLVWTGVALLGVGVLLVLALAVPVELRFSFQRDLAATHDLRVSWLFGLVGKDLRPGRKRPRKPRRTGRSEKPRRRGARMALALIGRRGLHRNLLTLLRRCLSAVRVKDIDVDLRLGLGDPASTGMAWGLVGPAAALVSSARPGIRVTPDFREAVLAGHARGAVQVVPLKLVAAAMLFIISPITIAALVAVWKARR